MHFTKNEQLTTKEMIKRLKISKDTWYKHKEEILSDLALVINYSIHQKGSSIIYLIQSDGDYEYNSRRSEKAKEKDKIFEDAIMTTIIAQPLNTAANVARIIKKDNTQIAELDYADSTTYEYTRVRIRDWFGTEIEEPSAFGEKPEGRKGYIAQKVWCLFNKHNNTYTPMEPTQVEEFITMISQHLKYTKEAEIKLLADYDAGTITQKEFVDILGELKYSKYTDAKKMFKDKYGYYPIKVPEYLVYGYYTSTTTQTQDEEND